MTKRHLAVVEIESGKTVHTVDVSGKSDNFVDRVLRGMLINADRDRFFIRDSADGVSA